MRSHANPAAQIHAIDCDCDACQPASGLTQLADVGAAGFFLGAVVALLLAAATHPVATVDALLAAFGIGL